MLVGGALAVAADEVIEKGKAAAAVLLQAEPGRARLRGRRLRGARHAGRRIGLIEAAERAAELVKQGAIKETLDTKGDVETGALVPERLPYRGGRDRSRHRARSRWSPTRRCATAATCSITVILKGQVHGGVAQGLGQALKEHMVYDPDSGQVLTGSFMDYGMPRAFDLPPMQVHLQGTACTTNPLGVKGVGEAGTTAAPCAIVNAVINALPPGSARPHRHAADAGESVAGDQGVGCRGVRASSHLLLSHHQWNHTRT